VAAAGGEAALRRRLHAIHPAAIGQEAAATAFALALLAGASPPRPAPLLWVQERQTIAETGRPYGPGFLPYTIAPEMLVIVRAKGPLEALTAAEMGLEEAGLSGVIVELPARLPSDMLKLTKRLSLRAEARAVPCLMLHATPVPTDTSAATRWMVAARPPRLTVTGSVTLPDWALTLDLVLDRNRFGPLGRWAVRWEATPEGSTDRFSGSRHAHNHPRFTVLEASAAIGTARAAHSQSLASPPLDGPAGADIVRLGRAA
jgi:protein ImuA